MQKWQYIQRFSRRVQAMANCSWYMWSLSCHGQSIFCKALSSDCILGYKLQLIVLRTWECLNLYLRKYLKRNIRTGKFRCFLSQVTCITPTYLFSMWLYVLNLMVMQIFISRDGGSKKYASVLAPGQHEGLGWGYQLVHFCKMLHS